MKLRDFLIGFLSGVSVLTLGIWIGSTTKPIPVHAQQEMIPSQITSIPHSRYLLTAGPYGENSFYAIKLDQQTGEAQVLTGKKGATDDKWLILPEQDKRK